MAIDETGGVEAEIAAGSVGPVQGSGGGATAPASNGVDGVETGAAATPMEVATESVTTAPATATAHRLGSSLASSS